MFTLSSTSGRGGAWGKGGLDEVLLGHCVWWEKEEGGCGVGDRGSRKHRRGFMLARPFHPSDVSHGCWLALLAGAAA